MTHNTLLDLQSAVEVYMAYILVQLLGWNAITRLGLEESNIMDYGTPPSTWKGTLSELHTITLSAFPSLASRLFSEK